MRISTVYEFRGGPLDGRRVEKTWAGRIPDYLKPDESMAPLRALHAERITENRADAGRSCYVSTVTVGADLVRVATFEFVTSDGTCAQNKMRRSLTY